MAHYIESYTAGIGVAPNSKHGSTASKQVSKPARLQSKASRQAKRKRVHEARKESKRKESKRQAMQESVTDQGIEQSSNQNKAWGKATKVSKAGRASKPPTSAGDGDDDGDGDDGDGDDGDGDMIYERRRATEQNIVPGTHQNR